MKIRISAIMLVLALTVIFAVQAFASFPDTTTHKYSTAINWIQADCADSVPPQNCRTATVQTPTGPVPATECY